jgi:hypothetical protein
VTIPDNVIRGRLKALSVADILLFLKELHRAGRLVLADGRAEIALELRGAWVIRVDSDRSSDRLDEVLFAAGRITGEQREEVRRRVAADPEGGVGRALVAAGLLSARALVAARREQARRIVLSLFDWTAGEYRFEEGRAEGGWSTPLDLPISELVADGVRAVRNADLFVERIASPEWVFEPAPTGSAPALTLDSHEQHILGLADGRRSIAAIEALAEYPAPEVRRVLFLLLTLGWIRPRPQPASTRAEGTEAVREIVRRFNGLYGRVYEYMTLELGPISESLLNASLGELEEAHAPIFRRARLTGDGTLNADLLEANLRWVSRDARRVALEQGLHELLYRELLVLRRAMGPEHERRLLHLLKKDGLLQGDGLPRPAAIA